jgi:putative ABC transport system permease protein
MINIRWRKVLRELWINKARTILVVLSVAVGVFAVGTIANSWIVLLNDLNTAYLATNPASAILTVEPFGDEVVSAVEGMREVRQAEGRRSLVVKLHAPDGELINLNLYAVEDFGRIAISRMTPESGAWPPSRRQIVVERSWASRLSGVEPGGTLTVEMPDGREYELIFTGYAHDLHHPNAFVSDTAYGYVNFDTLEWLGESRAFNQLYLTVAEKSLDKDHIGAVATRVKEMLERDGYLISSTQIPTPGEHFVAPIVKAILLVLGVIGLFSLLLSGALVVNTISAVIARQVRQIGVMKAIGGRTPQITGIYLALVAIFGVLSLGVAVPLALLGTRVLTSYVAGISNFDVLTTGLPPIVVVLETVVGLLVPLGAALIPISFGTRVTVREAINDYGIGTGSGDGNLIDRLVGGVRGVPGIYALTLRNTFRRKARLALTLLTLTLSGAIFVAVLSVRVSLFATLEEALGYARYDVSVTLAQPYRARLVEREALRVPGVDQVEGWLSSTAIRVRPDGSESSNYLLTGVPPETEFLSPTLIAGRWLRPADGNAVVVSVDFSKDEPDVRVGDTITLTVDGKDVDWTVVGVVTTQFSVPPNIYTTYESLGRELNQPGSTNRAVIRTAQDDADFQAQAAQALEERFKRAGLLVGATGTSSEFAASFEARFNILTVFMLFMAFLLATVGGLGLAGTMGLNVLERVREIGVMRAIGASDGAVQRIVLAEGIFIGLLSWALAAVFALPLSKALSDGVGIAFGNEPLAFSFSLSGAVLWLGFALLIALVSSYLPARRASRLSVREVLTYE